MDDLCESLDEKKKKRKKRKGGKRDGKGSSSKGYTLRDWFKGGGWVQTGGKYDGKPCAKQPGQKTKPYCRDPDDRSRMSKKERDKRAKKKRKEDPNPDRRGKAKNVKQKKSKKKNEELYMDLEQMIREELEHVNEGIGTGILVTTLVFALATKLLGRKPESDEEAEEAVNQLSDEDRLKLAKEVAQQAIKDMESKMSYEEFADAGMPDTKPAAATTTSMADLRKMRNRNLEEIVKEELEAALDEKRKKKKKKKKKKKAKRDACYHKVKSRYKVWPSAYASGALVKCRKVGAKNWGNSKKESVQIMIEDEISQVLHEKKNKFSKHDMYDPKTGEKSVASVKKDHDKMAKKGFVHVDPKKIEKILRDEGGAAGMDPFLKEFGEDMKDEIVKALDNMPNVGQHEDGDYILDDDKEVNISEGMNCGCGQDPCKTYGKNNAKIKVSIAEEIEKVLEEALYYGLIEENIEEKKKKRKKKACKPSKGKKFARRVKGKCVSYGQSGKAKGGGPRIKPGTGKGNAYCARSYGDMKSHGKDCSGKDRGTPLCLSRQKWKCSGKYSRKGK